MAIYLVIGVLALFLGVFVGYFLAKKKSDNEIMELKLLNSKLQTNSDLAKNLQEEFKNIANQALIDNQNELHKQNATTLEDKLKPLSMAIERYQKEVDEFNKESTKEAMSLKFEITKLMENSKTVQEETHRLTRALTQNQNSKGQFGEDTLEIVLNSSGMNENIHYVKQFSTTAQNADGEMRRVYPDFIVKLPEGRHVVIDSKMNLENFIKFQNEEEKTEKEKRLREFKADIKNTIKKLSEKNYQMAENINSPDFIFMYIPLENSLSILYDDIEVVEFALSKNVILIGTVSLVATLRLVQSLMAQEKQHSHVMEIAQTGTVLYEKFVDFCENLKNIQKKFKDIDDEFKTTLNRFTRGEDSLFKKTEKLKELGVRTTKQIPNDFLNTEEE